MAHLQLLPILKRMTCHFSFGNNCQTWYVHDSNGIRKSFLLPLQVDLQSFDPTHCDPLLKHQECCKNQYLKDDTFTVHEKEETTIVHDLEVHIDIEDAEPECFEDVVFEYLILAVLCHRFHNYLTMRCSC